MKPRHQVSRAAIDHIKRFEGLRQSAAQLPDGRWTIGYGHTLTAREGAKVSEADAEALLMYDLIGVAHSVNELTYTPLNQNQFDALCAFAFNIGVDSFRRSSVLRRLNEGSLLQAACAMEMWRKADFEGERIVVDALVRRRSVEKTLFLTPMAGWSPAPSSILKPQVDYDSVVAIPRQKPVVLNTDLTGDQALAEREVALEHEAPPKPSAVEAAGDAVVAKLSEVAPAAASAPVLPVLDEAEEEPVLPFPEAFPFGGRPRTVVPDRPAPAVSENLVIKLVKADEEIERAAREEKAVTLAAPRPWADIGDLQSLGAAIGGIVIFVSGLTWSFLAAQGNRLEVLLGWVVFVLGFGLFAWAGWRWLQTLNTSTPINTSK